MPTGTVKWFDPHRGYGFITPDGGGTDVFVHYTGIADGGFRSLEGGAKVTFELRRGRKGMEAFDVRPSAGGGRATPEAGAAGEPGKRRVLRRPPLGFRRGRAPTNGRSARR